jgi:hypothetical protein
VTITGVEKVEDCLDGTSVYTYVLLEAWSAQTIARLEELGDLDYFPDFPRPYFRVHGNNGLVMEGVEGETSCRVTLPESGRYQVQWNLERVLRVV